MRIAIVGNGRMGHTLAGLIEKEADMEVAGFVGPGDFGTLHELLDACPADVAMDFSYPGNLQELLATAVARGLPLVIGTTGYSPEQQDAIRNTKGIPIVWADNYSTGIAVLLRLARMAAAALNDFDIELVETHHNQKVDAPSGTAKAILKAIDPDNRYEKVAGRNGIVGARGREIGVHAIRGGTVAGEHSLRFYGAKEEIEIRHRADSREIFANGALKAVRFVVNAKAGLYTMDDVLFGGEGV